MNNRKATLGRVKQRQASQPAGSNMAASCNSDLAINRTLNEIAKIRREKMPKKQKTSIMARAQWDLKRKLGLPVQELY